MTEFNNLQKSQRGNAVVIVLVVLAVVAVGALAYLSGQISPDDKVADTTVVASSETIGEEGSASTTTSEPADEDVADADVDANDEASMEEGETTDTADASTEENNLEEEAPTTIEPGNPVVAVVGDEEINRLDVLNFVQQLPPNIRQLPLDQLFPLALDQVINTKVIENNVDTSEVEDNDLVQKQIEESRKQILQRAYLEKVVGEKMTDKQLKNAYDEAVGSQPDVEEVKAAHILVEEESTAKDIIKKLNDDGDFAELAKEYSKDGTAENGGDLGYFAKSDVVPEFADAAFSLKEGTYTKEPVKSQFGYHVIKLEEKRMRPKPTFEESKQFLENQLSRQILEDTIEEWKNDAEIKRFDINGEPVKSTESN